MGTLQRGGFVSCLSDSSDADRLERFFDSEDEDFEILSLWKQIGNWLHICIVCGAQGGRQFLRVPGPLLVFIGACWHPCLPSTQHSVQSRAECALFALGSRNTSSLRLQWSESGFLSAKHLQEVDAVMPRNSKMVCNSSSSAGSTRVMVEIWQGARPLRVLPSDI